MPQESFTVDSDCHHEFQAEQTRPQRHHLGRSLRAGHQSGEERSHGGGWTGGGEVGAELMAIDTATNGVIALAADEKQADFSQRFSRWDRPRRP